MSDGGWRLPMWLVLVVALVFGGGGCVAATVVGVMTWNMLMVFYGLSGSLIR